MADDINDKEDQFDFTEDGEALGYIYFVQARLLAMQTARETPGEYGGRFRDVSMAFDFAESSEDEDYYIVTLGVRPQGNFTGDPGQEQFFISKEGEVAHRQVLSLPRIGSSGLRLASIVIGILVAVGAVAAFVGSVLVDNGPKASPVASPTPLSTEIVVVLPPPTNTPNPTATSIAPTVTPLPTPVPPTNTPPPTLTPLSTYTPFPTSTPRPTFTPFPAPVVLPTYTPLPTYTQVPTPSPSPTITPSPTSTRRLVRIIGTTTPRLRFTPTPVPTATPAPFTPENYLGYIPLLDAYVSEVRFFESPFELKPESQRVYADRFDQASARYIAWEVHFDFPQQAYRTDFAIDAIFYREDGSEFARHSATMYVEPWWTTTFHASGWGWSEPGTRERGIFRVDFFVESSLVAIGEFQVR